MQQIAVKLQAHVHFGVLFVEFVNARLRERLGLSKCQDARMV